MRGSSYVAECDVCAARPTDADQSAEDGLSIVYTASSSGSGAGGIYSGGGTYVQPYPGPGFGAW